MEVVFGPARLAFLGFGMRLQIVLHGVADFVEGGDEEFADDVVGESRRRRVDFVIHQRNEMLQLLPLFGRDVDAGMSAELQQQRHEVFHVDVHALQKVGRNHHHVPFERAVGCLDDVLRRDEKERVFMQYVVGQVDRDLGFAFGADTDDEGIDAAGEVERLQVGRSAVGDDEFLRRRIAVTCSGDEFAQREVGNGLGVFLRLGIHCF